METFFLSQNLWDVVEDGYAKPPESASSSDWTPAHQQQYKENIQRNATALRYIQQGVSSEKAVTIKLQTLWKEFDNLSMKDSEGVQDFCSRVTEIVNQIKGCGDSIEDKKVNEKVLRCLPPKFDHVAAAIEESRDLSKMTFSDLSGSLRSHEQRINRPSSQPTEQAFQSKINNSDQNKSSKKDQKNGGSSQRNGQRGKGQREQNDNPNKWKNDSGNSQKNSDSQCIICKNEANFTKEGDGDYLFYSSKGVERESYNLWYLDSGYSNHMTGERDIFISLDQSFNSQVKLGDGKMQKAVGKGIIAVHTKGGNKKLISDVLYVPNLTQNLLSVGQLIQKGFPIYFDDEKCKIIDKTNNHTVAVVEMSKNKVFPLVMPLDENVALKTENSDLSNLWHLRYGHLNYKGLNLLKQKNMVIGLPDIGRYEKVCEGCIYGKMHRLPFPKNSWRAKAPLELVHADICGPTRTFSLNNRRYFILFVDDYTRMMWIYFLNEKSEAFSTFLQFKALAERQSGCKMKTLRTDRGERKNRTIVEMARSMLKGKGIPNNLWAEACHTAVYILNRSPTKAVRDKTPFEAWHNRKPTVDHLKIFGSIAYALIPAQNREKFDEKETFAPVARMETIRTVLALAAQMELNVFQLDVKSAFLNGEIEEEVYVEQPKGYEVKGEENKVYRLRKALYGLKQAPRAWNSRIDRYFVKNGFDRSSSEPSLYVKKEGTDFLIVCLYVDDLIYCGTSLKMVQEFKKSMLDEFEMTDLGLMKYFLGIQVKQPRGKIFFCQEKYVEDLLKKFHMFKCKPAPTPMGLNEKLKHDEKEEKADARIYRSLVGSLIYLTNSRPDILHSVSVLSRFMNDPRKSHYIAAKRILRYLQGTKKQGIMYEKEDNCKLVGFTDSDWAGSLDDRKSTSGYLFCLGTNVISWSSRKQKSVALSSTEAEYIAATESACEAVWLGRILKDLQFNQDAATTIYCDNMSAIALTKNPVFHYIRDLVSKGEVNMEFISTNEQPSDFLTKAIIIEKGQYSDAVVSIRKPHVFQEPVFPEDDFNDARASHLAVATLIAMVAFAAAFTIPGGYKSENGTAILRRNTAFQEFMVTDTIAMILSLSAVFTHFWLSRMTELTKDFDEVLFSVSVWFALLSMAAMVIAFVTGTYAMLAPSLALAIITCLIGLNYFVLAFLVIKDISVKNHG
ncbi:hypothetical protein KPL71_026926 [Citrus sinensis]|uniref:Uncharacterized protein n=1 Tax=Citrus sinensis TaxID=2711 RepID=A0ACB8I4E6_CITSI|nr:hypothetical protein KPL71_026926 [Citrus sinensis]